jgi:FKBP-type peptidyl-prolyl cis-trans isomerase SlyD
MIVADKKVVSFHYTLSNAQGDELESSRKGEPMSYLHGSNNIIPGLEKAMVGRSAGDVFQVTVEPADAYGERKAPTSSASRPSTSAMRAS